MPIFIRIENKERKELFNAIKNNYGGSWEKIYPYFGIGRTMFFHYLAGRYDLPETVFLKMKKISNFNIKNYKKINKNKYIKREIPFPKMNVKLAEILGVLNGDGHISNYKYEICIVLDSREKEYHNYIKNLFYEVFGAPLTFIHQRGNAIKLRIYSIDIFNFLTKKVGLPKGKKKGCLRIPSLILSSHSFLINYFRGLFDTDGTIYLRRKKEPVIEISSVDKAYLHQIKNQLLYLGFKAGIGEHRAFIYNRQDIIRFFKQVKPANPKHLNKFQKYFNLSVSGLTA